MFLIKIFKKEKRREGKERRKRINPKYLGSEKRTSQDRRSGKDRRGDVERRSGMYYRLSDKQKDTVDTLIDILEKDSAKEK